MSGTSGRDYFDRARIVAVSGLAISGAMAIAGSFMVWAGAGNVPKEAIPQSVPNIGDVLSDPMSGFDAGEGKVVIAAAVFVLVAALLLAVSRIGKYGLLGLVASMVTGAVAFSVFKGIGEPASDVYRRLDLSGQIDPGIGLILCAAAGLLGVLSGALGMITTPPD